MSFIISSQAKNTMKQNQNDKKAKCIKFYVYDTKSSCTGVVKKKS